MQVGLGMLLGMLCNSDFASISARTHTVKMDKKGACTGSHDDAC